ncbi:tRNA glutamyl-Q(34) synthetase GluQRS [Puniceicoccaceae bacterium K14]|nr:tRNA glutamyl-Q(34) synthetase GluQRS [Puniceicoccaceae bacterium K14]
MRKRYRGRIAPTPTGYMHLGHARTFLEAQRRAQEAGGDLVLRIEDLDKQRCKKEYVDALVEDLSWVGLEWNEGPDVGGEYGSYYQSERLPFFEKALCSLIDKELVYPCFCSRKDIANSIVAPHSESGETIYPGTCRNNDLGSEMNPFAVNWRFRVSDGQAISFNDAVCGNCTYTADKDFGDFLVWRKDGLPSYELAVVVDDIAMEISEVVRGEDLLLSTARQILLYEAFEAKSPNFFHCPLVLDEKGNRLAKRSKSLGLRVLREREVSIQDVLGNARLGDKLIYK